MFYSVKCKLPGTRKVRDFTVYPVKAGDDTVMIQSSDAIARVNLATGEGTFAVNAGGAYGHHLALKGQPFMAPAEVMTALRSIPAGDGTVLLSSGTVRLTG